ncbi:MAG TPA: LD-carboxypeptidase [Syntrophorhabdaceae bacterium]|nr:LD-carboxypeptidase [Syntrophorhabdaceae bacterium]
MRLVKPAALRRGDKICILSPASPNWAPTSYRTGKRLLEEMGFEVTAGRYIDSEHLLFAGDAKKRADDINAAFRDKSIKAIFCNRGGTGTSHVLPYIDFSTIRENPKILVGYSDITALQIAIFKETDLVTFYGPMVSTDFGRTRNEYTTNHLFRALMDNKMDAEYANPPRKNVLTLHKGTAEGQLVGGCLSVAVATLGTKHELEAKHKILFFEDVDEKPHRIDRYLMQLTLSGKLQECEGIILGTFTRCNYLKKDYYERFKVSLMDIIKDRILPLHKPCIFGLQFGHVPKKMTIPVGACARLDATHGRLIIEAAVQ